MGTEGIQDDDDVGTTVDEAGVEEEEDGGGRGAMPSTLPPVLAERAGELTGVLFPSKSRKLVLTPLNDPGKDRLSISLGTAGEEALLAAPLAPCMAKSACSCAGVKVTAPCSTEVSIMVGAGGGGTGGS